MKLIKSAAIFLTIGYIFYMISMILVIQSHRISIIELTDISRSKQFLTFLLFCIMIWPIFILLSFAASYMKQALLKSNITRLHKLINFVFLIPLISTSYISKFILIICISLIGYGFLGEIDIKNIETNEIVASGNLIIESNHVILMEADDDTPYRRGFSPTTHCVFTH